MSKKEEEIVEEEVAPKAAKSVEEDEPHKALRAIIEAYKIKNPVKYEQKKEALEARLKGKLAFGLTDGKPDGSVVPVK